MSDVLFQIENTQLQHLLSKVKTGELGLPDLQRPFVWQNNKVRDFNEEFLENYNEFSPSWRLEADKMNQRKNY